LSNDTGLEAVNLLPP